MGMTWAYGGGDEQSGLDTIQRALELGVTLLDTAEVYGPIPGTKRPARLEENAAALELKLSDEDVAALDQAVPAGAVVGGRYREAEMALISG
jgi:aryl-alcohol dehydrogenase-like predicted oxidoreductase